MKCCVLSGVHVPGPGLDAIWDVAMDLILNRKTEGRINHTLVEGVVRTEGRVVGIGDIFGYKAEAEVDSAFGSGTLTFIIRVPRNGDDSPWITPMPFGNTTLN